MLPSPTKALGRTSADSMRQILRKLVLTTSLPSPTPPKSLGGNDPAGKQHPITARVRPQNAARSERAQYYIWYKVRNSKKQYFVTLHYISSSLHVCMCVPGTAISRMLRRSCFVRMRPLVKRSTTTCAFTDVRYCSTDVRYCSTDVRYCSADRGITIMVRSKTR